MMMDTNFDINNRNLQIDFVQSVENQNGGGINYFCSNEDQNNSEEVKEDIPLNSIECQRYE